MNFSKVKGQFGSWAEHFQPFIESKEFDAIFKELKARSASGAKIYPDNINVFRCFKETSYQDSKVIILAQDPYSGLINGNYIADGLALSSGIISEVAKPLSSFYDGMEKDLSGGFDLMQFKDPDLTYLTRQGVLLLNTALTTEEGQAGLHRKIWKPFIEFLMEHILQQRADKLVFILIGNYTKTFERLINKSKHYVFAAEHPEFSQKAKRDWKHDHIFSCTNKVLKRNRIKEIDWYQRLPF